jgi:large subunit ribosomal protein L10
MDRAQKQGFVEGLAGKLAEAQCVYVTDFTGLDVERITLLRSRLRGADVDYVVVKNTLARRALAGTSAQPLEGLLEGPTAFALGRADAVAAAKVLTDFAKERDLPRIKGGVVAGRIVSLDEIRRLASLPGRAVLLSQLTGSLKSPIYGLVFVLAGVLSKFVRTVDALRAERAETAEADAGEAAPTTSAAEETNPPAVEPAAASGSTESGAVGGGSSDPSAAEAAGPAEPAQGSAEAQQ